MVPSVRPRLRALLAITACLACLAGLVALASAAGAAQEIARAQLPNGLTVIAAPREEAPLVAAVVLVKVSAFDETAQTAGIRQLLQQVMMRGTTHLRGDQIAAAIEEVGGAIEASTAPDYVEFDAVCLAGGLDRAVDLLADIVCNPAFDPAEVAGQRQMLMGHQRTIAEDDYRGTLNSLLAALYPHHAYGLPTYGTPDTVPQMTVQTLQAFHAAHYLPADTIVAVTGGATMAQVLKAVKAHFGSWTGPTPPTRQVTELPPLAGSRLVADQNGGRQITLMIGYRVAGADDPDYATLKVIESLLGGGMISRFFRDVRERQGLAYQVNCLYEPGWQGGYLIAYALTGHQGLEAPRRALLDEFQRLRDELVPDQELEAAKRFTIGQYVRRTQSSEQEALALAWAEGAGIGYGNDTSFPDQVMKVTPQDVMRVAGQYFGDYVLALRLPAG
jgi:zinc protease